MDKKARKKTSRDERMSTEKSFMNMELSDEYAGKTKGRASHPFKTGDSVVVKKGMCVPDCEEVDIGGWVGRVREIVDGRAGEPPLLGIVEHRLEARTVLHGLAGDPIVLVGRDHRPAVLVGDLGEEGLLRLDGVVLALPIG